jgi:large subunit ribosomal protein L25
MELTVECQTAGSRKQAKSLAPFWTNPSKFVWSQGTESIALALDGKIVERLLKKGAVNNTLIDLNITDIPWRGKTLLREVQTHPAKGSPLSPQLFCRSGSR